MEEKLFSEDKTNKFHQACWCDDFNIVNKLINDEEVNINKQFDNMMTSFHIACKNGNLGIVRILINNNKIRLNIIDKDNKTGFYIACERGHYEIIELLSSDKRINLNIGDKEGETQFLIACKNGYYNIVKFLIDKVDINKRSNDGNIALYIACIYNHYDIVKLILDNRKLNEIQKYKQDDLALSLCKKYNRDKIIELIYMYQVKQENEEFKNFWKAAIDKDFSTINKLLMNNDFSKELENVRVKGYTLLIILAISNDYYMIDIILKKLKSDTLKIVLNQCDGNGKPFLHHVITHGSLTLVKYIFSFKELNHRIKDKRGNNLLHVTAFVDKPKITDFVLSYLHPEVKPLK
mgnify:CR=1 FL=1